MNRVVLLILSIVSMASFAQRVDVEGLIYSKEGPLPFIKVYIKELSKGTVTDAEGKFKFAKLPAGNYEISTEIVGFEPYSLPFTVVSGEVSIVNVETRYSSHKELKTELSFALQLGKRIFMNLSGDYYRNQYQMDFNNDGFTDIPLNDRLFIFNKRQINTKVEKKSFSLGMRYLNEVRFGGQMDSQSSNRALGVDFLLTK